MQGLMIGCGNMGGALLRQWAETNSASFTIVDPFSTFDHPRVDRHAGPETLGDMAFDFLVVAVKPQLVDDVLPDYHRRLAPEAPLLSIAAGVSSTRLSALLHGRPVARVMPNMPASIGRGVSGLYFSEHVEPAKQALVRDLMLATGDVVEVDDEDDLDKITAIAGSGPGYMFEIARAFSQAAQSLGFDEATSRRLVLGTIAGAVEMALRSSDDLATLRASVTSKAGTTEAGLEALNGGGDFSRLIEATALAAYRRAVELR